MAKKWAKLVARIEALEGKLGKLMGGGSKTKKPKAKKPKDKKPNAKKPKASTHKRKARKPAKRTPKSSIGLLVPPAH